MDLGGIKVPGTDWEATPESIKLVLMTLVQKIEALSDFVKLAANRYPLLFFVFMR